MKPGRSLFFGLVWIAFGLTCAFGQKLTAIKCGTLIDVQVSKSIGNAVILVDKFADIIAVEGNPLNDVTVLEKFFL